LRLLQKATTGTMGQGCQRGMAEDPFYRPPAPAIDGRIIPNKEALGGQELRVSGARGMIRLVVIPVEPMNHHIGLEATQLLDKQVKFLKDTVTYGSSVDDPRCRTALVTKNRLEPSWPGLTITNAEAKREGIAERQNDG